MQKRSTILALALTFAVTLPLAGCGDNDNNNNDNSPGGPTRTPTPVRTAVKTATPVVSPGEPTPTATAQAPTATPTEGGTNATPTATATPSGAVCQTGEHVMATLSLNKSFAAFVTTLTYPATANIPGSGASIGNRVVFATTGGFSTASDDDDNGADGVDDTLHASYVNNVNQNPGAVYTVTFDCVAGQPKPAAGEFSCTVTASACGTGGGGCDPEDIPDIACTLDVR
jgi:hypothetical protein